MEETNKDQQLIGVALVQWNHSEYTVDLLNDLLMDREIVSRVVVCDNGSEPTHWQNIIRAAERLCPNETADKQNSQWRAALIRNRNNSGFAAGINVGISELLTTEVNWIWLLNNDVRVQKETLENLDSIVTHLEPGVYGTNIISSNGDSSSGLNSFNKWTTFYKNVPIIDSNHALINEDVYIDGASMIVHRSVMESVGLFSEKTFLYFEELDFARRLNGTPYKQNVISEVGVEHIGAGSSGKSVFQSTRMYHETWSTLAFYNTHHKVLFFLILFLRTPLRVLMLCFRRRFTEIPAVGRATWDFLSGYNRDKKSVDIIESKYFQ